MNMDQKTEIIADEVNLYDYWKIIVKRKNIFLGIFLIPLVTVTIVSFILPRYYRGESEIINPVIPAQNMVGLVGNIDDAKKVKIFANNSGAIKSVTISISKKSADKVSLIVDAKTADIVTLAFKNIFDYISNLPEIQKELAKIKEENDLKLNKLIEAKETNNIFLNYMKDIMKKRQLSFISVNPAYIIQKDVDLSLEVMNLQRVKATVGILLSPSITKQPSNTQIKQIITITVILCLLAGFVVLFFLVYIEQMKARENK